MVSLLEVASWAEVVSQVGEGSLEVSPERRHQVPTAGTLPTTSMPTTMVPKVGPGSLPVQQVVKLLLEPSSLPNRS